VNIWFQGVELEIRRSTEYASAIRANILYLRIRLLITFISILRIYVEYAKKDLIKILL